MGKVADQLRTTHAKLVRALVLFLGVGSVMAGPVWLLNAMFSNDSSWISFGIGVFCITFGILVLRIRKSL